jgi:ATP-binding cassette, subfamily B, bacterial HlyB/CyaB
VDRSNLQLEGAQFVWALGSISQLHRVPFDAALLTQQFAPPYDIAALLTAARGLGFKAALRRVKAKALPKQALPCLALVKRVSPPSADCVESRESIGFALILKAEGGRLLFFEPGSQQPTLASVAEVAERYCGQVILCAPQVKAANDEEAEGKPREFSFRWFVPELLKHKRIWRDVLLASLVIQLMALAMPLFTQTIIDKVVVHRTMSTLTVIGLALLLFMVFTAIMSWVRQYLVIHTGNRVDAVLGTQVFEKLFSLPARYFEHRPTGVLVARLHGVETIREFISGAAVSLILDLPFLLIFLGVMFYYSVPLSLISLTVLAVIVALSFVVAPMFRTRLNEQFMLGARAQAFLTEYVAGMETVKSLQMEPQLKTKYGDYLATYLQAGFKTKTLGNTYNTLANTLEQFMSLAILCVGAYIVMNPAAFGSGASFTIGMLVAFQMFASRLSQPLLRLVGLWQQFQQANIAVKRLGDIMNAPAEPYSLTPSRENAGSGKIEVKRLAFRYGENLPYLYRDFNLTLEPGKCVALMGASGTGKSTLAKLMLGFYQPSDGQILIDGRDIRYLSANELRSHFGVVPQDTILFSGTIYDNLILANPLASFEQVIQACKMAEMHDTIEKLPQGYQTEVGERGVGLSGGQKQRIAIARALLRRPKVLIFDEATSNLDHATAEQFAKTINALKGHVTMLFITHQVPKGLKLDEVVLIGSSKGEEKHFGIVASEASA